MSEPLLLRRLPELAALFPWTPLLAPGPTPLTRLADSGLWVKRDDLACPRYGGNKARKFEWILGKLLARPASARRGFLTFGGLCSNHATASAIYGRAAGLDVHLCFLATPLTAAEYDELRLQAYLGAHQAMAAPGGALSQLAARRAVVPPAGSSVAGVLGYVNAGLELAGQIESGAMPAPSRIFLAAATGGTALGLAMGLALAGAPLPVVAVETVTPLWQRARALLPAAQRTLNVLRRLSPEARARLPERVRSLDIRFLPGFDADPLGVVGTKIRSAQDDAGAHGLVLDAHFSARAWAALPPQKEGILFWHTHGRAPDALLDAARRSGAMLPEAVERAARRGLTFL